MKDGSGPHGSARRLSGLSQGPRGPSDDKKREATPRELKHAVHGAAVGIRVMCVPKLSLGEEHDLIYLLNRIDELVEEMLERLESDDANP